ncbi:MAG: hypothetical protein NZ570_07430 [Candidatus Caldarchaeum sp.]|nr:hypothetical protein [Candidatus Caldarchaeum sp.]MDW8359684.1 hypothetical protein [Candidatus Caldarchaeum sp.]
MFSKQSAVKTILRLGDALASVAERKNLDSMTVGVGELRKLLNAGGGRGKSVLSLALQRFTAAQTFRTSSWVIEVVDVKKPILVFRRRAADG